MQGAFAELSDLLESYRALRAAAEGHVDASLVDAVAPDDDERRGGDGDGGGGARARGGARRGRGGGRAT